MPIDDIDRFLRSVGINRCATACACADQTRYERARARLIRLLNVRTADLTVALQPFAKFAECFDAKPLSQIADEFYQIHPGTPYEAGLRLSHCRRARRLLDQRTQGGK